MKPMSTMSATMMITLAVMESISPAPFRRVVHTS